MSGTDWRLIALVVVLSLFPQLAVAQGLEHVQANYTKYEFRIPTRDGKTLFTAVYVPKDDSQTYPIMLKRTPYNAKPYGVDQYMSDLGPSALFGKEGYIFAYQDVRGRWMSEGEIVNMRPHLAKKGPQDVDESTLGHRIMVQIHSTWFPLVDRNPQTFVNIPAAKPSDFRKATQRVFRSEQLPSRLTVLQVGD